MAAYLTSRVLSSIVALLGVTLVVFALARLGGDPGALLVQPEASQADIARVRHKLDLDRPVPQQFATFLGNVVHGDLGKSLFYQINVTSLIKERLPNTLRLALAAFAFALLVGIPVGIYSAARPGGYVDRFGKGFALIGQSAPSFWIGIMLIWFFGVRLKWLPTSGIGDWRHYPMPALTLGWFAAAAITRLTRSAMLDVLNRDFVRFLRSTGVREWRVMWVHALRHAGPVVLTIASLQFVTFLAGAVTIESVFGWPGMGQLSLDAITRKDYPIIQGVVLLVSVAYVLMNLIVDLIYPVLDPRVRYTRPGRT